MHPQNPYLQKLQERIEPLRQEIIHHKVYAVLKSQSDLHAFMEHHIYAVWDFMSLLKALQNNLTCTSLPWLPKGSAETRFLINEIVVGEESDVDQFGKRCSHFELYHKAMQDLGAKTHAIDAFIKALQEGTPLNEALQNPHIPKAAQQFVQFTFEVINSGKDYLQAGLFTFGREDLIPQMFLALLDDLEWSISDAGSTFKYYLERHIEVDGGHHGHLALQMLEHLCGNDATKWDATEAIIIEGLKKRIQLWDGVFDEICKKKALGL